MPRQPSGESRRRGCGPTRAAISAWWRGLGSLVGPLLLAAAGTAHAQYAAPYSPYPGYYPPPIYIPEPGHPAGTPQDAGRRYPPPIDAAPRGGWYGSSPAYAAPPPPRPGQGFSAQPAYSHPPPGAGSPARALLAPQNAVRARVGDPPLQWSASLAQIAQRWADHLLITGQFRHRSADRYGENLYEITGGTATAREVVGAWAGEAQDYNLRTNACSGVCGHYTQIVWRSTRMVGCAVAGDARRQVWVCEYDPAGNWVGYRPF